MRSWRINSEMLEKVLAKGVNNIHGRVKISQPVLTLNMMRQKGHLTQN